MNKLYIKFICIFILFFYSAILFADYKSLIIGKWNLIGEFCDDSGDNCKKTSYDLAEFNYNNVVMISGEVCWYKIKKDELTIVKSNSTGLFKVIYIKDNMMFLNMINEKKDKKITKKKYNALFKKIK